MKGLLKMKNVIKTFVIAILSIIATIIVCNINTTTTANAETYDIEEAYELVNKELELYASCYNENDGTFNVDYDTAYEIAQLEADFYSNANRTETEQTTAVEETTTTTTTIATTIKEETTTTIEEQTTPTTTEIKEEQTTITEQQHYIECNQCKEEANEYVNQEAEIYNSVFDGTNFNIDYDTACKLVELEFEYYSTPHEHATTEEPVTSETNLNSAYDYVNQEAEIYSSCYDGYDFNIDYDTACDIVQLQMEYYSK